MDKYNKDNMPKKVYITKQGFTQSIVCDTSNGVRNGKCVKYYGTTDDRIRTICYYDYGKKIGDLIKYGYDRNIICIAKYDNGKLISRIKYYNNLTISEKYINGVLASQEITKVHNFG